MTSRSRVISKKDSITDNSKYYEIKIYDNNKWNLFGMTKNLEEAIQCAKDITISKHHIVCEYLDGKEVEISDL